MNPKKGKNSHPGRAVYASAGTETRLTLPANSRAWWITLTICLSVLLLNGCSSEPASDSVAKGKALAEARCVTCHSAEHWKQEKHTHAEWESVIEEMISHGAQFTKEEQGQIADFLSDEYGK